MGADDELLKQKKVLMVGAGGIGCELLKTLVLSGFEDIQMIDMDTIETSNLNRQFLFRRHHVGKSKAQTAREAVLRFRPNARIVAHHDNVKDAKFDAAFFSRFDVVLNGLDNMEARRHVNRMCLSAGVPLVESGTAGYLGQVSVHIKGVTECFECQPKPTPKTYPVCTIRNTPDKPIHCIVWAKDLLFATLFGPQMASDLEEAEAPAEGDEDAELAKETAEEVAERAAFFRLRDNEPPDAFAARIYARAFGSDIERLLRITDMWGKAGRTPPTPLPPVSAAVAAKVAAAPPGRSACASLGLKDAHVTWDAEQAASVYLLSCARLAARLADDPATPLTFDKDDALAVEFVAASAALRGINYGIPGQSLFMAKGMAGNIIHAIATTNAIISGLIVMEAVKLLRGQHDALKCTWVQQFPNGRNALLVPTMPSQPSAACYVCRRQRLHLELDLASWTLGQLIEEVLGPKLGVKAPTVTSAQTTLYEGGDGLDEDEVENYAALCKRTLPQLPCGGLNDGDLITVQDETAEGQFEVEIKLVQRAPAEGEGARAFDLLGNVPKVVAAAPPPPPPVEPAAPAAAAAGDDECIVLDGEEPEVGTKRKRGDDNDEQQDATKHAKPAAEDDDEIIVL